MLSWTSKRSVNTFFRQSPGEHASYHGTASECSRENFSQTDAVPRQLDRRESEVLQLKSDMPGKQERVIELQEELIAAKEVQMVELRDTVVTVKNQTKSYCEAVQEAQNLAGS